MGIIGWDCVLSFKRIYHRHWISWNKHNPRFRAEWKFVNVIVCIGNIVKCRPLAVKRIPLRRRTIRFAGVMWHMQYNICPVKWLYHDLLSTRKFHFSRSVDDRFPITMRIIGFIILLNCFIINQACTKSILRVFLFAGYH